jgi:dTDP-4-amino-4,6-dideoxygalactose transaminase
MKKIKKVENIYVTRPLLPKLEEYIPYIEKIWNNKILTNNEPFHQQLEEALATYLRVKYISLFANGTLALITALQARDIKGEVITTPFSFVATSNAIVWNKTIPVFVDIESEQLNINPQKIEAAITSETSAIMPVHAYGNPCRMEEIDQIAKKTWPQGHL